MKVRTCRRSKVKRDRVEGDFWRGGGSRGRGSLFPGGLRLEGEEHVLGGAGASRRGGKREACGEKIVLFLEGARNSLTEVGN